jgi:serine/threonine protein kinase/Tol biopolymer transport system component
MMEAQPHMGSTLAPGARIGAFEIVGLLGAGGMGEVYRARDTRLGREVAIKVLPNAFARDADRLARFEREARTLASLNHPNIAQVYGFEESALVMELIDGETLRDHLRDGALPARKATDYATQIARGLAAAHERGIIHRDLKPENVFVLRDGHVKILDFGLARPPAGALQSDISGTVAVVPPTEPGTVMGTVGYMAPEQVRGQEVDARSDLFALGVLFREMLTGQPTFQKETAAETMTAILKEDPPDLATVRSDLSPALDRIVRHCLEKSPIERFQTARDVAFALASLSIGASGAAATPTAGSTRTPRERWVWAAATGLLAVAVIWLTATQMTRPDASEPVVHRLLLPLPENIILSPVPVASLRLAVSPDGRRVAFVGSIGARTPKLWVQSLTDSTAHDVKSTENAVGPNWSHDSKRVSMTLGSSVGETRIVDADTETMVDPGAIGYVLWGPGTEMLGSTGSPEWTVRYLAAPGAPPTVLLKPSAAGETFIAMAWLPDGKHFLVWHRLSQASARLEVASLGGGERSILLDYPDLGSAKLASGALIYARSDRLFAQRFDAARRRLTGQPVPIAERVDSTVGYGAAFSVSDNGVLVYAGGRDDAKSRLGWMDREGHVISTVGDDADYSNVELSPDGRRLAVSVTDPAKSSRDIYIVDLDRGVRQRLTFDPSEERSAVWSPDGREIVYNSKGLDLYRRPSDFTGSEQPVQTDHASKDPRQISPDGKLLLYRRSGGPKTDNDIWITPLDGSGKSEVVLGTPFSENYAMFSPDARSIVYVSNESGRFEVYVISREGGGKAQISTGGGSFPRWRRDGREIVYLAPDQTVMSVPVSGSGRTFQAGTAKALFTMHVAPGAGTPFDVTPDGTRFIVNMEIPSRLPPSLNVVTNWPALLGKR